MASHHHDIPHQSRNHDMQDDGIKFSNLQGENELKKMAPSDSLHRWTQGKERSIKVDIQFKMQLALRA